MSTMEAADGQLQQPALRSPDRRVAYFYDADVGNFSYGYWHPMKPHRMRMAHALISAYGLHKHMHILRPKRATREDMTHFHADEYIDFLSRVTPETVASLTSDGARYLISEDCPAFEGLFEFCSISAGGSLAAASRLNTGQADIAINWAGGLHHAKKREASGFCYVNDIVLAILELLRTHLRVLYIDIDVHHGDGVEEAFYTTDRVMTASFHKFGDFFPGTGDLRDVGIKKGKAYSVNVPLRDGIGSDAFQRIFQPVIQHIMDWYRPGAVVLQCGADSLAGDKLGCFNLNMQGHADCVTFMKSFNVPLVVLGGGGYTIRNVARTWCYETGVLVGADLPTDLPLNPYIQYFGPEYKLEVPQTSMEDFNTREYLDGMVAKIIDNLKAMPFAPSVPIQEAPRNPLNPAERHEADLSDDEDSELDERISQSLRDTHVERYNDSLSDDESASMDGRLSRAPRRGRGKIPRAGWLSMNGSGGIHIDDDDELDWESGAPTCGSGAVYDPFGTFKGRSTRDSVSRNTSVHSGLTVGDFGASRGNSMGHDLATRYLIDSRGKDGVNRRKRNFFASRAARSPDLEEEEQDVAAHDIQLKSWRSGVRANGDEMEWESTGGPHLNGLATNGDRNGSSNGVGPRGAYVGIGEMIDGSVGAGSGRRFVAAI